MKNIERLNKLLKQVTDSELVLEEFMEHIGENTHPATSYTIPGKGKSALTLRANRLIEVHTKLEKSSTK